MQYVINIVEDEKSLNEILTTYLKKEDWIVHSFHTGEEALASSDEPHLWILDIMLPDIDGFQLLKEVKKKSNVPVIFISARDAELDRVIGLEMGCDDYISKPFLPRELTIRVKNVLQRVYGSPKQQDLVLHCGEYQIFENKRDVLFEGTSLELTAKEFDLLCYFCNHKGVAFSRENILITIWGEDYFGSDRVVDDLIRRLRKKMPNLPLETIYGYGYRMPQ
ncbi:DNA-binding response regulator [Lottiidibacillus patelloidae]|uniref:DNA-binding response regulator n=1 Tax=Lottiidibacillus patelloidae TaxID=2670334 RepID=A0A263BTQ9_9BACI|nr:response regulator transcription factor [Lottiidibacillus patelloidae]OZM57114.1 DNA-binding response regulator [Lottiidibacillus patelloidae]